MRTYVFKFLRILILMYVHMKIFLGFLDESKIEFVMVFSQSLWQRCTHLCKTFVFVSLKNTGATQVE